MVQYNCWMDAVVKYHTSTSRKLHSAMPANEVEHLKSLNCCTLEEHFCLKCSLAVPFVFLQPRQPSTVHCRVSLVVQEEEGSTEVKNLHTLLQKPATADKLQI